LADSEDFDFPPRPNVSVRVVGVLITFAGAAANTFTGDKAALLGPLAGDLNRPVILEGKRRGRKGRPFVVTPGESLRLHLSSDVTLCGHVLYEAWRTSEPRSRRRPFPAATIPAGVRSRPQT